MDGNRSKRVTPGHTFHRCRNGWFCCIFAFALSFITRVEKCLKIRSLHQQPYFNMSVMDRTKKEREARKTEYTLNRKQMESRIRCTVVIFCCNRGLLIKIIKRRDVHDDVMMKSLSCMGSLELLTFLLNSHWKIFLMWLRQKFSLMWRCGTVLFKFC